jgi:SAM-dependent methyltransferase
MKTWIDFWDGDHAIYVNDRHKRLHAAAVGRNINRHVPSPDAVVLDHGCGEALYAIDVACCCRRLILCEAADNVREALGRRLAGVANIAVIGPAGVEGLADRSVDLIVANSLVQYLSPDDLVRLLAVWRRKLKETGALVVADIVPPDGNPLVDAAALLRFGWQNGFLLAALHGLVRTAFSDYGRLRKRLGFAMYDEAGFLSLIGKQGFRGECLRPNFGHNQARLAFRAIPDPAPGSSTKACTETQE